MRSVSTTRPQYVALSVIGQAPLLAAVGAHEQLGAAAAEPWTRASSSRGRRRRSGRGRGRRRGRAPPGRARGRSRGWGARDAWRAAARASAAQVLIATCPLIARNASIRPAPCQRASPRGARVSRIGRVTGEQRMRRVYLDHNASTPVHPEVLAAMLPYFARALRQSSSVHGFGREARDGLDTARERIARFLGVAPEEIVFTSGGTESDNLAIKGCRRRPARRPPHHAADRAPRGAADLPGAGAGRLRGDLPAGRRRRHGRSRTTCAARSGPTRS